MSEPPVTDGLIDKLVRDVLHRPIGWHESLKQLEDLARGNFEWADSQVLEDERLRNWWPKLTAEARVEARNAFWRKFDSDPVFRVAIAKLTNEHGVKFP